MTEEREVRPSPAAAPERPGAFFDAVERGDVVAAEGAARLNWFELTGAKATDTAAALGTLDDFGIDSSPLLSMLSGVCGLAAADNPQRCLHRIAAAVSAAQDDSSRLMAFERALILSAESVRSQQAGDAAHAGATARAAMRWAREAASRLQSIPLTDLYTQIGVSLHYTGEVDLALEAFSAGQSVAPAVPNAAEVSEIIGMAAAFGYEGDIPLAARYLAHCGVVAAAGSLTPDDAVRHWVAESMIALESFDSEGVLSRLDVLDDAVGFECQVARDIVAAMARLLSGDAAGALAELEAQLRTIELRSGRTVPPSSVSFTRSLLRLSLGDARVASAIIESDFAEGPSREVARARVELAQGHPGSALRRLAELSTDPLPLRTAADASAIEVAALLRQRLADRTDAAVDYLGALLARTGLRVPLAFLPKADFDRVVGSLRAAGHGQLFAGVKVRSVLPDLPKADELTARERTVLSALMDVGSAAEIARMLFVSPNTVKSQLRSIYRKLGVANRQEAITVAVERRLLASPDADGSGSHETPG